MAQSAVRNSYGGYWLKLLCVVDEFTRECLALEMRLRFWVSALIDLLALLIGQRCTPVHLHIGTTGGICGAAGAGVVEGDRVGPLVDRAGWSVGESICVIVQHSSWRKI